VFRIPKQIFCENFQNKKREISQIYTRIFFQKVPKNLAKKIRKNRLKKKISSP
jgi:hypothetical protein